MDCREIKNLLEQYIDNDLGKDDSVTVTKHLSLCKECSEEFALLKKYKLEMSALKTVKAPADFIQQLNARIDNQSFAKKIIKSLFFPLKFKLPIGAAGVLTLAVLVAVLVNPLEQMRKDAKVAGNIALNENAARQDKDMTIEDLAEHTKKSGAGRVSLPAETGDDLLIAKAERKPDGVSKEAVKTHEIILALYQVNHWEGPTSRKSTAPRVSSAPLQEEASGINEMEARKAKSPGAIAEGPGSDQFASGEIAEAEKESQTVQTEKSLMYSDDKLKDESAGRKLNVSQSVQEIKNLVISLKGKVVKDYSTDGRADYIIAEIPAQNRDEFLRRLGRLGIIHSKENKTPVLDKTLIIRYKIDITPPE